MLSVQTSAKPAILNACDSLSARSQYQLDFFPAGNGDAGICLRYESLEGARIIVYDGGSLSTGHKIVAHIREQFQSAVVHDVICSHPHVESAAGLIPILENLEVQALWMHRPWIDSNLVAECLRSPATSAAESPTCLNAKLAMLQALEQKALERHIPIWQPFQGAQIGPFTVMSPHREWYLHKLIPDFENTLRASSRPSSGTKGKSGYEVNRPIMHDARQLPESWQGETLTEWGAVSADMESSVVLYGMIGSQGILLTGNAGIKALTNAASYAEYRHLLIPNNVRLMQIPCSGDHNHLSPSVLDRLVGPKRNAPDMNPRKTAFASRPYGDFENPHHAVVNALIRRGALVAHTDGKEKPYCRFSQLEQYGPIDVASFSIRQFAEQ